MRQISLLLLLFLTACRESRDLTLQSIEEIFCDGTTITTIVKLERIRVSRSPLSHGSRYDERWRWTGAVTWNFPATPDMKRRDPTQITALGHDHSVAKDETGASLPDIESRAYLNAAAILHVDFEKGKMSLRRASDPMTATSAEVNIDVPELVRREALPTRSAKHLLATHKGKELILSSSDLQIVRELASSPGFDDFQKRFRGIEDHVRVLTDDLRYLVKVPFNAGEPQGHNHCKAVVYDLTKDSTFEVALTLGKGPTGIDDVESLDGDLVFLAEHDGTLCVVDSRSTVLAKLPDAHFGGASLEQVLCWDPVRERIASWVQSNVISLVPIEISDHNYETGVTVRYELDWGRTIEVLGAAPK